MIADIEGVWVTTGGAGADGNETVFMITRVNDAVVQITRDDVALDLVAEDIDPAQGTATFRFRAGEEGENKRITFGKVASPGAPDGGFTLRVTYPDGRSQDLSFVRRLGKQDIADMERAFDGSGVSPEQPVASLVTTSDGRTNCAAPADFRARAVCKDEALRDLDTQLAGQFEYLQCWNIDVESTRKAAYKQLDACTDSVCLSKAYASWTRYMDDNYDIGDVVCDNAGYDYQ